MQSLYLSKKSLWDFFEYKQKYKQLIPAALKRKALLPAAKAALTGRPDCFFRVQTLKLAVFLGGSEFRLRI